LKVLVTGGAGYIGSHFVRYLIEKNHEVIVLDNLSRGHIESINEKAIFENADLMNRASLDFVIKKHSPEAIVHFAAFAYVGESVEKPELYYENNVVGSFNLINAAVQNGIKKFVFSSTCSLYGNPERVPIAEDQIPNPINPYANTKFMIEKMLSDFEETHKMKYVALRYFNAAGAHPSAEIGESHDPEPHLIPIVLNTALGKRDKVLVFGDDYDTPDGTCIRDYIHIIDLADAHLKALEYLEKGNPSNIFNLGTGEGNSVLEIINKAKEITNKNIPFEIVARRGGDPARLVADNKKAKEILGWIPKFKIDEIITTAWKWHSNKKY
jgi:UDP-glucose 4-epimerase